MPDQAVKFTQSTAKEIQKAVTGYLGEAVNQYGKRPRRLSFQKQMIPVSLSTDGGSNADFTTGPWPYADYTYTATTLDGKQLLTSASPTCKRPKGILVEAATHGIVCMDGTGSGTFILWTTDEQQDIEDPCTVPS